MIWAPVIEALAIFQLVVGILFLQAAISLRGKLDEENPTAVIAMFVLAFNLLIVGTVLLCV